MIFILSKSAMMVRSKSICSIFFLLLLFLCHYPLKAQDPHPEIEKDFFPFSVWYSGGKARAPMLSRIDDQSEEEWRKDLQQIRDLGFNTVRTWVEWATCEPEPGQDRKSTRLNSSHVANSYAVYPS